MGTRQSTEHAVWCAPSRGVQFGAHPVGDAQPGFGRTTRVSARGDSDKERLARAALAMTKTDRRVGHVVPCNSVRVSWVGCDCNPVRVLVWPATAIPCVFFVQPRSEPATRDRGHLEVRPPPQLRAIRARRSYGVCKSVRVPRTVRGRRDALSGASGGNPAAASRSTAPRAGPRSPPRQPARRRSS
jgi:hypothetical protein